MRVQSPYSRPVMSSFGPGISALLFTVLLTAVAIGEPAAAAAAAAAEPSVNDSGGSPVKSSEPPGVGKQRAVFVCEDGDVPVFSDRPCDAARASRTVLVQASPSGAVPSIQPPLPRAVTRPRPLPDGRGGTGRTPETRCTTLQRQLDELDDRMRAGYASREAARLWNRWRELKARLRTERC